MTSMCVLGVRCFDQRPRWVWPGWGGVVEGSFPQALAAPGCCWLPAGLEASPGEWRSLTLSCPGRDCCRRSRAASRTGPGHRFSQHLQGGPPGKQSLQLLPLYLPSPPSFRQSPTPPPPAPPTDSQSVLPPLLRTMSCRRRHLPRFLEPTQGRRLETPSCAPAGQHPKPR